jgi:hypothetical protein
MNAIEFEQNKNQMRDQGYRMIDQKSTCWVASNISPGSGSRTWKTWIGSPTHDVTSEQFSDLFTRYSDLGYLMIDIDAYMVDGWAALFSNLG